MALRVVEVLLPASHREDLHEVIAQAGDSRPTSVAALEGDTLEFRFLTRAEQTGALVDAIEKRFGNLEGFRLLIMTVDAALPRPEPNEADVASGAGEAAVEPRAGSTGISRQELYAQVQGMAQLDRTFLATVVLSTVVAAVGMLRDSVAVLIGAMVIAPMLGPNVALALAATLADRDLSRRAMITSLAGITLALGMSVTVGAMLRVDPSIDVIASRTVVQLSDIALALAAGSAAVLALTRGISSALVGVMVAVALLPPTVVVGLMLGAGRFSGAVDAAMLVLVNVICVNLAGVLTFVVQGVEPLHWWEARRARRSRGIALVVWVSLLVLVAVLIALSRSWL